MGPQCSIKRSGLGLASKASSLTPILSEVNTGDRNLCRKASGSWGSGDLPPSSLSGTPFLRQQKELPRQKSHSGSIDPQPLHPLPEFQNDHNKPGPHPPSPGQLFLHVRSQRRILARANCKFEASLSRLPYRNQGIQVQSSPLWPQHRPKNIHQTDDGDHQTLTPGGHKCGGLLGRLVDMGHFQTGVPGSSSPYSKGDSGVRLPHQRGKVSSYTQKDLRLARPTLAAGPRSSLHSTPYKEENNSASPSFPKTPIYHKTSSREAPRPTPVCIHCGQCLKDNS